MIAGYVCKLKLKLHSVTVFSVLPVLDTYSIEWTQKVNIQQTKQSTFKHKINNLETDENIGF